MFLFLFWSFCLGTGSLMYDREKTGNIAEYEPQALVDDYS